MPHLVSSTSIIGVILSPSCEPLISFSTSKEDSSLLSSEI